MPYPFLLLTLLLLVCLYLLLIRPARNDGRMKPFLQHHYAHRGLHDQNQAMPENSLTAFAAAVAAGYGIELDVQISREGVPVVFHDYTLDRICGRPGNVKEMTLPELQACHLSETAETIPSLEQVLQLVDGRVPLIVEIKGESADATICSRIHALLQNYQGDYVIESFNPLYLSWWRRHAPSVLRGQLSANLQQASGKSLGIKLQRWLVTNLLSNCYTRPDFIAYKWQDVGLLSFRLCRNLFQAPSVLWTITDYNTFRKMQQVGDAFIFEGFLPEIESSTK